MSRNLSHFLSFGDIGIKFTGLVSLGLEYTISQTCNNCQGKVNFEWKNGVFGSKIKNFFLATISSGLDVWVPNLL